jgi:hypothetical protein
MFVQEDIQNKVNSSTEYISIEGDKQNKENRGEKRQFEKKINLCASFY